MNRFEPQTSLGLRRLSVNTALQLSGQLLPLASAAVAIPIVYRNLGATDFGVFTIALSVFGLFSILDLGLGRATVRFTARAFGRQDLSAAASILAQSVVFLAAVSLCLAIFMLLLSPAIASHWIKSQHSDRGTIEQCLLLLSAAAPIGAMTSVFRSALEAREDFRSIGIIQSAAGSSTYLVPLALSLVENDVRTIVGAMVACRALALAAYVTRALTAWPSGFPWSDLSLRGHREFREFSFWTIGSNLLGAAIVYGDRALLVRLFGLAEIPFYNVPLEFFGRIMILTNSLATVIFPPLSRLSDNKALFERAFVAFMTLLSAAAGLILLIASLVTPQVLLHWLGAPFLANSTHVVRILMVGLEFQCLNVMALASLNARGVSRPIMLMHLAEAPLYFGAMTFFGLRLGLDGIALVWSGRLVVEFICFTAFQVRLVDSGSARSQWVGAVLAAANGLPLALVAASIGVATALPASIFAASLAVGWALLQLRGAGLGLASGERA